MLLTWLSAKLHLLSAKTPTGFSLVLDRGETANHTFFYSSSLAHEGLWQISLFPSHMLMKQVANISRVSEK